MLLLLKTGRGNDFKYPQGKRKKINNILPSKLTHPSPHNLSGLTLLVPTAYHGGERFGVSGSRNLSKRGISYILRNIYIMSEVFF